MCARKYLVFSNEKKSKNKNISNKKEKLIKTKQQINSYQSYIKNSVGITFFFKKSQCYCLTGNFVPC